MQPGTNTRAWRCNYTHRLNVQSPPGMGLASNINHYLVGTAFEETKNPQAFKSFTGATGLA